MGFISLCAKPHKTHVPCTWVHEVLLVLLNPIDKFHLEAFVNKTVLNTFIFYRLCVFPLPLLFSLTTSKNNTKKQQE